MITLLQAGDGGLGCSHVLSFQNSSWKPNAMGTNVAITEARTSQGVEIMVALKSCARSFPTVTCAHITLDKAFKCVSPKPTEQGREMKEQGTFWKWHNLLQQSTVYSTISKNDTHLSVLKTFLPTAESPASRVYTVMKNMRIQRLPLFQSGSSAYKMWELGPSH